MIYTTKNPPKIQKSIKFNGHEIEIQIEEEETVASLKEKILDLLLNTAIAKDSNGIVLNEKTQMKELPNTVLNFLV